MNARNLLTLAVFAGIVSAPRFLFAEDDKPAAKEPAQVFAELDKNADGKLTAGEIPEAQKRFFERLLRVAGKDKEGELTKDEFLKAMKPDDLKVAAPQNPGGPRGFGNRPPPDQMFQIFDRNKDGKVSLDEIPEQARERFKPIFDKAEKKELTHDEFVQALAQRRPPGAGNGGAGVLQDPEAAFKRLDANQDGKLTVSETPEPFRNMIERWLRQSGKEKDGSLSLDEIKKIAAENRPAQPGLPDGARQPQSALFKKLDTNGDGKLSKEELQKAASLFEELDLNKDGLLDPSEVFGLPGVPVTRPAAG